MKTINNNIDLTQFEFWSGAKQFADNLTPSELSQIQTMLEDLYPDGLTETELNDIFWFEDDMLCEWLGLDIDEVYSRND